VEVEVEHEGPESGLDKAAHQREEKEEISDCVK